MHEDLHARVVWLIEAARGFEWAADAARRASKEGAVRLEDPGRDFREPLYTTPIRFLFPEVANAALAAELYMKGFLILEVGDHPNTHNLVDLHDRLRERTQIALQEEFGGSGEGDARDLRTALGSVKDAFLTFRYPHEWGEDTPRRLLSAHIPKRVVASFWPVLLSLHPDLCSRVDF